MLASGGMICKGIVSSYTRVAGKQLPTYVNSYKHFICKFLYSRKNTIHLFIYKMYLRFVLYFTIIIYLFIQFIVWFLLFCITITY